MKFLVLSLIFSFVQTYAGTFDSGAPPVQCIESVAPAGKDQIIEEIYSASAKYEVPPHVLFGAITQETGLNNYGILKDFGNYSCGISQFNIVDWCNYIQSLSPSERAQYEWPEELSCEQSDLVYPEMLDPYLHLLSHHLGKPPSMGYNANQFKQMKNLGLSVKYLGKTQKQQSLMRGAVHSFSQHCSETHAGVNLMAFSLKDIFDRVVPVSIQNGQHYQKGETFPLTCRYPYPTTAYPLHVGWILADAIYNFGENLIDLIQTDSSLPGQLTISELQDRIAWSGHYDSKTGLIQYLDEDREKAEISWFRTCVNQRHVSNISNFTILEGLRTVEPIWSNCEDGLKMLHGLPFVPSNRKQK